MGHLHRPLPADGLWLQGAASGGQATRRRACRRRTGRVISGPAFSAPGETKLRFTLAGGALIERSVTVASNEAARREPRPYRILAAAATFVGRDAGVVVRLNRAMPTRGEDRPPVMLGASLLRNEVLPESQRYYGGITPGRTRARPGRFCYFTEAQQLVPRTRLRDGARSVVGIRAVQRLVATLPVTLRAGGDVTSRATLRRAGC